MNRVEQLQELENKVCQLFSRKGINYQDHADYGLVGALIKIEDAVMTITDDHVQMSNFAADGDLHPTDCASIREALLDLHTFSAIALMVLDARKNDESSPLPVPLVNPVMSQSTNNMTTVELLPNNEDAALMEVALENAQKQLAQAEDERRRERSARKNNDSKVILHGKKDKKKRWRRFDACKVA